MNQGQMDIVTSRPGRAAFRPDIRTHILDAVRRRYECDLEELVRVCASYTWNQVFLEVDRLSRTGELRLTPKQAGGYAVKLPQTAFQGL